VAKMSTDWGKRRTLLAAVLLVVIPSLAAILVAPIVHDAEFRKSLYAGAVTLFFAGLLGGMVKVLLDEVAAAKRKREDAGTFVVNVLADLKSVYDRVARARILIPAHKSVKTYGEEMRDLIEARVQLRNVTRALERRAEGIDEKSRDEITCRIHQMETYLETLTSEFRDNYKELSDKQRGYEERTEVILKRFAEAEGIEDPPDLPRFVWDSIARLEKLSDFVGEAIAYKTHFEIPLDDASELLRNELARILSNESRVRAPVGTLRSSAASNTDAPLSRRSG
jgi:hypothetical protein